MIRAERQPDRVELRKITQPEIPGKPVIVNKVNVIFLPDRPGLHSIDTGPGEVLVVDMDFRRIDPDKADPHVILEGPLVGDKEVVIYLNKGFGRTELDQEHDVVLRVENLTRRLKAMHKRDRNPRRHW